MQPLRMVQAALDASLAAQQAQRLARPAVPILKTAAHPLLKSPQQHQHHKPPRKSEAALGGLSSTGVAQLLTK